MTDLNHYSEIRNNAMKNKAIALEFLPIKTAMSDVVGVSTLSRT